MSPPRNALQVKDVVKRFVFERKRRLLRLLRGDVYGSLGLCLSVLALGDGRH